jgi:hypothetical protein
MSCERDDDNHDQPEKAQKSQCPGCPSSRGRTLGPVLAENKSRIEKPTLLRVELTNGDDPSQEAVLSTMKEMVNWIDDSRATHHMTSQREVLTNVHRLPHPTSFSRAGTHRLESREIGGVKVSLQHGKSLIIRDIHYVPESRVNLLSTHRMITNGWDVRLTPLGGYIKKGNASLTLSRRANGDSRRIVSLN